MSRPSVAMDVSALKEKENEMVSPEELLPRLRLMRNLSKNELMSLKRDLRAKVANSDVALNTLDTRFEELKKSFIRMAEVIDECQNLVKAERAERKDIQYILRDNPCATACKTNIVIPMVAGIPLKKARVFVKRLAPVETRLYLSRSRPDNAVNDQATATSAAPSRTSLRGRNRL